MMLFHYTSTYLLHPQILNSYFREQVQAGDREKKKQAGMSISFRREVTEEDSRVGDTGSPAPLPAVAELF